MSVVYGAYGVDYVGGGEGVRGGYFGGAGGAAVQSATFAEERWAGRGVDGAVLWERESLAETFGFGRGCV